MGGLRSIQPLTSFHHFYLRAVWRSIRTLVEEEEQLRQHIEAMCNGSVNFTFGPYY